MAYNSLLIQRRKEIHEKIGRAIEEIYSDRLQEYYEMLAYHYSRSDNFYNAYQYCKLAGDKAERNYSHWEAYGFYKDAKNLLDKLPQTEENKKRRIEIFHKIRITMGPLGFPAELLEIFQEGERLSKELRDDYHLARFYSDIGSYYTWKGNPTLGRKYTESAFEKARANKDIELMGSLAHPLSMSYDRTGENYKIVDMAPDVIDLIEKAERKADFFSFFVNPYSILCAMCGNGMGLLGNFEKGKTILD